MLYITYIVNLKNGIYEPPQTTGIPHISIFFQVVMALS